MNARTILLGRQRWVHFILVVLTLVFCSGAPAGRALAGGWADVAGAMAVDSAGNVYVTGSSEMYGGSSDMTTVKYGPDGQLLWEQRVRAATGKAIAVDKGGFVYVTGSAYRTTTSSIDYVTAKYGPNGAPVWIRYYDGPGHGLDEARAIGLDDAGNVFVTGASYGGGATGTDWATIRYSPSGVQRWVSRYNGKRNGSDEAFAIAVSADGYAHVTGRSYESGLQYASDDPHTIKYDPSGKELWSVTTFEGKAGHQCGTAIALDGEGNVFITGPYWYWNDPPDKGPGLALTKIKGTTGEELYQLVYRNTGPAETWDEGVALVVDRAGYVYATGKSKGNTATGDAAFDFITIKYSVGGGQLWVSRYNGPANGQDEATHIALDGQGNVLVTGRSWRAGTYDYAFAKYRCTDGKQLWVRHFESASAQTPAGIGADGANNVYLAGSSSSMTTGSDYATLKYSTGGVMLWEARYAGVETLSDLAVGLAVDGEGNVYVTGTSYLSASAQDFATVAYSPAGTELWTRRYDGPYHSKDEPVGIGVDNNGGLYVAGTSAASSSDLHDYATIKYDTADGAPLWTRRYDKPGSLSESATAMAVDGSGNVTVTGYADLASGSDLLTVKYNATGAPLWVRTYNGPANGYEFSNAIAVDQKGNTYVTGESWNSSFTADYLTVKYDDTGRLWAKTYNGTGNDNDVAQAVGLDGAGNVYVTGFSTGDGYATDMVTIKYNPTTGQRLWTSRYHVLGESNGGQALAVDKNGNVYVTGGAWTEAGGSDYLTIKYDPDGKELWAKRYNGPGNGDDLPKAIVVDNSGNAYVTGQSQGTASSDYATIKYGPTGTRLWVKRYDGPGHGWDGAVAIALDKQGHLYVTGTSYGGKATAYDYATIKYGVSDGGQLWVRRYDGNQ
jgi:uncharacterized delta-60 repeat protein